MAKAAVRTERVAGEDGFPRQRWLPPLLAGAIGWLAAAGGGATVSARSGPYVLLALAAYLALRKGAEPKEPALGRGLRGWLWAPPLAAALTTLWSVRSELSYHATLLWIAFALAVWLAATAGRSGIGPLYGWLTAALALPPTATLLDLLFENSFPHSLTFQYKNAAGIAMAVLTLLSIGRQAHLWQAGVPLRNAAGWGPTLLGLFASFFLWHALSRASVYLAAAGGLVIAVLMPARLRWPTLGLGALLLLAGNLLLRGVLALHAALAGATPTGSTDLSSPFLRGAVIIEASDYSFYTRLDLWQTAWRAFLGRPWGWGPGTFGEIYFAYWEPGSPIFARSAHSLIFGALVESGPLLLLGLVAIAVAWLLTLWRRWPLLPHDERPLLAGAVAGLFALAGHAAVDFTWEIPAVALSAAVLLGGVAGRLHARGRPPAAASHLQRTPSAAVMTWGLVLAVLLLVIRPHYAGTLVNKGRGLLQAGRLEQAAVSLSRATWLDPLNSIAYSWLGEAYYRRWQETRAPEDLARAEAAAGEAARRAPRVTEIHDQVARYRLAAGDEVGYRTHLEEGLHYSPLHLVLRVQLADFDLRKGQVAAARARLEQVVADRELIEVMYSPAVRETWWPRTRMALAHAYLAEGNVAGAVAQLEQLLKEHPDTEQARDLLVQLRP